MEVSLLGCEGLPKGCFLSVRAGSSRRQAPVDVDKFRLAFPKAVQGGEAFKVDVLANLGGCSLPFETGVDCYDVNLGKLRGKQMRATLLVRQAATKVAAGEPAPPAPCKGGGAATLGGVQMPEKLELRGTSGSNSRRHRAALSVRRYLDEHNLLQWAETLFEDLIKEQPKDPWSYIQKQTLKAQGQGPEAVQSEVVKAGATEEAAPGRGGQPGSEEPRAHAPQPGPGAPPAEDAGHAGGPPAVPEGANGPARQPPAPQAVALEVAGAGSRCGAPPDVQALRERAGQVLASAAKVAVQRVLGQQEASDHDVSSASPATDTMPGGLLALGTAGVCQDRGLTVDPCSNRQEAHDNAHALRSLAKATLISAARDGRLAETLSNGTEGGGPRAPSLAALCEKAHDTILRASSDGRLAAVLAATRQRACDADVSGLWAPAEQAPSRDVCSAAASAEAPPAGAALARRGRAAEGAVRIEVEAPLSSRAGPATSDGIAQEVGDWEDAEHLHQSKLKAQDALHRAFFPEDCRASASREERKRTMKKARSALVLALAPADADHASAGGGSDVSPEELKKTERKARAALLGYLSPSGAGTDGAGKRHSARAGSRSINVAATEEEEEQMGEPDVDVDLVRERAARAFEAALSWDESLSDSDASQYEAAALGEVEPRVDAALKEQAAWALERALLGPSAPLEDSAEPGFEESASSDLPASDMDSVKRVAAEALEAALLGAAAEGSEWLAVEAPGCQPGSASLEQRALWALRDTLLGSDEDGLERGAPEAPERSPLGAPGSGSDCLRHRALESLRSTLLDEPVSRAEAVRRVAARALEVALLGSDDEDECSLFDRPDSAGMDSLDEEVAQVLESSALDQPSVDVKSAKLAAIRALEVALLGSREAGEQRPVVEAPEGGSLGRPDSGVETAPGPREPAAPAPASDLEAAREAAVGALEAALLGPGAYFPEQPGMRLSARSLPDLPDLDAEPERLVASCPCSPTSLDAPAPDIHLDGAKQEAARALVAALLGSGEEGEEERPAGSLANSPTWSGPELDDLKQMAVQALEVALLGEAGPEAPAPEGAGGALGEARPDRRDAGADSPRDPVEEADHGVASKLPDAAAGDALVKKVAPASAGRSLFTDSIKDLEARLLERNDRLRRENDAMRAQNARLKKLGRCTSEVGKLGMAKEKMLRDSNVDAVDSGRRRSKSATRF